MFKWFANTFEITERHLTTKYIRRTSILSWIVVLSLVLDIFYQDWDPDTSPAFMSAIIFTYLIVFLIAVIMLLVNPLVMRFWARDAYLDEWELDVKRRGMKSGFTMLLLVLLSLFIYLTLTIDYSDPGKQLDLDRVFVADMILNAMIVALFFQVQTQLRRIQPIDDEDWTPEEAERKSVFAKVTVVIAVIFVLIGPPMCQGMVDGFNDAVTDANDEGGS